MDYKEFLRQSVLKNEQEAKEMLQEQKQSKAKQLLQGSGIPKRFRNKSLDDLVGHDEVKQIARGYIDSFPRDKGLLLSGSVGTGKTHIATAIGNELLKDLNSVYFGTVIDVISFIKSTYSSDSEITELEAIKLVTEEVDLFIIDDLGKENSTEYTLSLLYQLINRVYENEGQLIVTTNFNSLELRNKLGERGQAIVSRIIEICRPITIKGDDWRIKNGKISN